ncbi:hypothetical protein ABIA32_000239 [Streptacidiphilus sp. MAP12-20]|uniref:hypothetical protein n=1 Tax=Streptacidiphilus sp. MAP12-20 TaxID=3156299 RepID=UPI0035132CD8
MRSLRYSRLAKLAVVAATALGLAAGATGTANAAVSPWLTGSQMPQAGAFHWQAQPQYRYTTTGQFQWLYTCGTIDPTRGLHTSSVSVEPFATKARGVQGTQILFHFSSAVKAKAALKRIETDYANCAQRLDHAYDMTTGKRVHARVDRTAVVPGGVSYRLEIRNNLGRPADMADIPSDAQEFFVQRGNTISFVSVDGSNPRIDVTTGSLQVLKTMAARLG